VGDNLKSKTIYGLIWSSIERTGQQAIQFVFSLIMARLLAPEQFGLIAMLTIIIAISQTILDSGFAHSLVNRQNSTYLDECSVFYFNIMIGFVATLSIFFLAPAIASFYNLPELTDITRVLSIIIFIYSFGLIQMTLMVKHLDFRTQMRISLTASIISGIVGITMASMDYGVWSLVFQTIVNSVLFTIGAWLFNPWRPAFIFSFASLKSMFQFGSRILMSGILNTIFENIYQLIIGKFFSAKELGFYAKAKGIQSLPLNNITGSITRVTFAVFSSVKEDRVRLKRGFRKVLRGMVFLIYPLMIGLMVTVKPFVVVLLTEKWLPIVPFVQLLCVIGLIHPLQLINQNVIKAIGRSDVFFRIELYSKVLILLSIVVTFRYGISAMIIGHSIVSMVIYYYNSIYAKNFIDYPFSEQLIDILPTAVIAVITGALLFFIKLLPFPNQLFLLFVQITVGAGFYLLISRLFRLSALNDLIEITKDKIHKVG